MLHDSPDGLAIQLLGWRLRLRAGRRARLVLLVASVVAASLVASAYPAWLARRVLTPEGLAPE